MTKETVVLPDWFDVTDDMRAKSDDRFQERMFDKIDEGETACDGAIAAGQELQQQVDQREDQLLTLLQSLADAGIEVKDGKVVDPWVRVEDGLPRQFQRVLIARTNKSVTDAWYESDNYPECPWRDGYGDGHDRSVTHWRPLPPAPAIPSPQLTIAEVYGTLTVE